MSEVKETALDAALAMKKPGQPKGRKIVTRADELRRTKRRMQKASRKRTRV